MIRPTALLACMLAAHAAGAQPTQPASQPASPSRSHIVVNVTGEVAFKRLAWKNYAPVKFGTLLQLGDLLRFQSQASVEIVCDGLTNTVTVAGPGTKPIPCAAANRDALPLWNQLVPVIPTARIELPSTTPGAAAQTIQLGEQILATYSLTPELSWLAVPGADSYRVHLDGPNTAFTTDINDTSTMQVSAWLPQLNPGGEYKVSIEALRSTRPVKTTATLSARGLLAGRFHVLEQPNEAEINSAITGLGKLGLPAPVVTFLTARALARYGQFDGAVKALVGLQPTLQEPALKKELGDIYMAQSSFAEAETILAAASAQYDKNGDVLGHALAEEALGNIQAKSLAEFPRSIAHFQAALDIYKRLGDAESVARVQAVLAAHTVITKSAAR